MTPDPGQTGPSRREREAAIGRLTANLCHEAINLLSVLEAWTYLLKSNTTATLLPEPLKEAPAKLADVAQRLSRMAQAIHQSTSGALAGTRRQYDLREVLKSSLALAEPMARTSGALITAPTTGGPLLAIGNAGAATFAIALAIRAALSAEARKVDLAIDVAPASATQAARHVLKIHAPATRYLAAEAEEELAFAAALLDSQGDEFRRDVQGAFVQVYLAIPL